jgi:hypothetical protein
MRVLYRRLPIFVVDAIFWLIHLAWAVFHGVPEWRPPTRKQDISPSKKPY